MVHNDEGLCPESDCSDPWSELLEPSLALTLDGSYVADGRSMTSASRPPAQKNPSPCNGSRDPSTHPQVHWRGWKRGQRTTLATMAASVVEGQLPECMITKYSLIQQKKGTGRERELWRANSQPDQQVTGRQTVQRTLILYLPGPAS